ncbi:MAG TPA: hypothetical protein VHB51_01365 [Candidatus Saccharimonadales bacterium]|nr:hypothetical protein [Candidatus Saccharimonadales bacterium]
MSPALVLGAIIVLPIFVLMLLRVNAALVFLSLCLGDVLVQFVAGDANSFFSLLSKQNVTAKPISTSDQTIHLVLLLFPVVLTTIFMIRTVHGTKLLLNFLPALGVGLLGALLVVPLLSPGLNSGILNTSLWQQVTQAQNLIVGSSALVCMFALWTQRSKVGLGRHHKKH